MDENERRRADQVLQKVLAHPEDDRERVIAAVCGADEDLQATVRRLLQAGDDEGFLPVGGAHQGPAWREMLSDMVAGVPARLEQQIGPWVVERLLGRGGMGAVYLARRPDEPAGPPVALKVVFAHHGEVEIARRFELERHILSSLDHPAIARLLDAGVADDGRQFLAMEYVEGQPIDRYCDEHRLTIAERVRLIIDVGRAVSHAHHRMVVHRDLKPSNILVTDSGQVKLLDFGIAKLTDPIGSPVGEPLTRTGLMVMTPEYASPEQVRGGPVSTATDIYQLGILLFELLTGRRPHRFAGRTSLEIEQVVCQAEAPAPSVAVERARVGSGSSSATELATACRARRTRPERLVSLLRGDLDTIVLKALRKEPERRYLTVDHLVNDLESHLESRPIAARRDSLLYRLRTFARRHRIGLAAAAAALVLGVLMLRLAWEREQAERQRALREAQRAEQVATFLEGLFDVASPGSTAGTSISATDLLERGAQRVTSDLSRQPHLQATLLGTLGDAYRKLGMYEEAEPLLHRARELHAGSAESTQADVASAEIALGRLHADVGRYDEAESCFNAALGIRERSFGSESAPAAMARRHLADVFLASGRLDEAESSYRDALPILEETLGPDDVEVAKTLVGLSSLQWTRGDYDEPEALLRRALEIYQAAPTADPREMAIVLGDLGQLYARRGDYERAEDLQRRSLAVLERALGPDHPDTAMSLKAMGRLLAEQGRLDEAEPLFTRSLAALEAAYPGDHPNIGEALNDLALLYWSRSEFDRAEVLLRRAAAVGERTLGPEHPDVAAAYNSLGALYWSQGRDAEAEEAYRRALEVVQSTVGGEHPHAAVLLVNLADVVAARGEHAQAVEMCERAVAINRASLGPGHPDLATSQARLAVLYATTGRLVDAEELLRRSVVQLEGTLGPDHTVVASTLADLCTVLRDRGRYQEAASTCRRALDLDRQIFGDDSPEAAYRTADLASVLLAEGDPDRARRLLGEALVRLESTLGPEDATLIPILNLHARADAAGDDRTAAIRLLERALVIRSSTGGRGTYASRLDEAETLVLLAGLLRNTPRHDQAAAYRRRALELTAPTGRVPTLRAQRIRAQALLQDGRPDEASPLLDRLDEAGYIHPLITATTAVRDPRLASPGSGEE